MLNLISNFFDENRADLKKTYPVVKKVNALEEKYKAMPDDELYNTSEVLKKELSGGKKMDDILPNAYAAVREVAFRNTDLRAYDVQIMGGALLHWGKIAEMKTGEGKTLVAVFPVYLNALSGEGVHVITVNDYLARRDAVWVGQIYAKLGMSVSVINSDNTSYIYNPTRREELDADRDELGNFKVFYEFLEPCTRKEAYEADITYGTNSEFGFDYLRDNISQRKEDIRQRGLVYGIVDEIDSILIDEARVPLIISTPHTEGKDVYLKFADIAKNLKEGKDYAIDEKSRSISLRSDGIDKAEKFLGVKSLYSDSNLNLVYHLETAIRAKALFRKEKEYIIKDGEAVIVDEFTGRAQAGRRWSDGLHQAVEAKEGLEIKEESKTFASITYQNYFKMYKKLSGMTGTAETSKEEFFKVYSLDVVVVPTNTAVTRIDKPDLVYATEMGKFKAIADKIKELNQKGQPVLVGTASVEKSELLSEFLIKSGIKHSILNAKNHEREGEIVANAGIAGAVTIATNMAGRGVDIKLGGPSASEEERQGVLDGGGLYVLATERHDSRRIDNQLRGRSGRQGDPGETQFHISLDDTLMRVFGNNEFMKNILLKKAELEGGEDKPIVSKIMTRNVEKAQEKIEGFNFDARRHVLDYDDVLDVQRKAVYEKRREVLMGDDSIIKEMFEVDFADDGEFLKEANLKSEKIGAGEFYNFVKMKYLESLDGLWIEHLSVMDHLKASSSLQSYGQKDSAVEYKKQARQYFDGLFDDVKARVRDGVSKIELRVLDRIGVVKKEMDKRAEDAIRASGKGEPVKGKTLVKEKIQGRNEKCACGSGKKYKNCHGKK